jgi:hypothetical protein
MPALLELVAEQILPITALVAKTSHRVRTNCLARQTS